jgi:hypothetical protein
MSDDLRYCPHGEKRDVPCVECLHEERAAAEQPTDRDRLRRLVAAVRAVRASLWLLCDGKLQAKCDAYETPRERWCKFCQMRAELEACEGAG